MKENLQDRLERENLKIASFGKRVLAFLIDDMVISLIVFIIFYDRLIQAKDLFETTQIVEIFTLASSCFILVIKQFLLIFMGQVWEKYYAKLSSWMKIFLINPISFKVASGLP